MTESAKQPEARQDVWYEWLLHHRFGDDPEYKRVAEKRILEFADAVLDLAELSPREALLDVGAGDGLVAFRALDRCRGDLEVTLIDISERLLEHARMTAHAREYMERCRFVQGSAEHLAGVDDASMDIVVARASIAYVKDKAAAFREMYRVLRPGGRFAMAEPILQEEAFAARILKRRASQSGADSIVELIHLWKSSQYPDTEEQYAKTPLVNFSERELLTFARNAGFRTLRLRLHIDVVPSLINSWRVFLASSPHPLAPSLNEILRDRFSAEQRERFEHCIRPTIESGENLDVERVAYLFGQKPA